MKTSQNGVDLIKSFEGCELVAYKDIVGVLTIGYGTTGPDVFPGLQITQEQAEAFLRRDLGKFEEAILKAVKVPLNQNQFDALVCFSYNVGSTAFRNSTLLKKLNAGHLAEAAQQFLVWNKAGGKIVLGLTRRRQAESKLFSTPV
jgi:lysozyme